MGSSKAISGIFFFWVPLKETFKERSKRWWAVVIIILSLALAVIIGLIALALSANSQIGVPVVGGTFLIALFLLFTDVYRKNRVKRKKLSKRLGYLLFIIMVILSGIITAIINLFVTTDWIELSIAVMMGGLTLTMMLLVLYEGYTILRAYGSPGFLTLSGLLIVLAIIYMTSISFWVVPFDPTAINVGPLLHEPTPTFPLGTTSLGQDMLSRTIAGGAVMLQVAFLSVVVCFSIGVPIGLMASYRGGYTDRSIALVMDSIFAFPGLVLAIAIAAILGPGVVNMALAIAVVYVPSYFRVIRSQVLTIKELPYIEAANALGGKDRDVLFRYVLPNALPSAVVVMSINFADAVLTAAGLTFIGLGLPINVPDWGWDLTFGARQIVTGAWWVITFPGLMIVILALGFTLIGEGLNEILAPRLAK